MYCKRCFIFSYASVIRAAYPMGIDGNILTLCSNTAFRLSLDESTNSLHYSDVWEYPNSCIMPLTSVQYTRPSPPFVLKNWANDCWRVRKLQTLTPVWSKFHCFNLEANSSALTFGKSKSPRKGCQMICEGGSNGTVPTGLRTMWLLKKVTWWLFWKCLWALLFKYHKFVIERDIEVFNSEFQGCHMSPLAYIAVAYILKTRANWQF